MLKSVVVCVFLFQLFLSIRSCLEQIGDVCTIEGETRRNEKVKRHMEKKITFKYAQNSIQPLTWHNIYMIQTAHAFEEGKSAWNSVLWWKSEL